MNRRSAHPSRIGLVGLFAATALSAGCSAWFAFNYDVAGLPCRAPTADDPRACLVGYTCIDTDPNDDDPGTCVPAQALTENEPCQADEECEEGLLCRDHFYNETGRCDANDYDSVCDKATQLGLSDGFRCRRECNPSGDSSQCPDGQRCYDDELDRGDGYCQVGVCATDAECGNTQFCVERGLNPDPDGEDGSGLCWKRCDPLACSPQGCNGCPNEDINGDQIDDILGCEPYEEFRRMVCIAAGDVPYGSPCDNVTQFCQPGSFCASDGTANYCAKFCDVNGSQPACEEAGQTCNALDPTNLPGVGICSR